MLVMIYCIQEACFALITHFTMQHPNTTSELVRSVVVIPVRGGLLVGGECRPPATVRAQSSMHQTRLTVPLEASA